MRRFTIALLGVVVIFVALAGSSALGQEFEYRSLFGDFSMVECPVTVTTNEKKNDPPVCFEYCRFLSQRTYRCPRRGSDQMCRVN